MVRGRGPSMIRTTSWRLHINEKDRANDLAHFQRAA
jgi:hypothetical protein